MKLTLILSLISLASCLKAQKVPEGYIKPSLIGEESIQGKHYNFIKFNFLDTFLKEEKELNYYYRVHNDSIYFLDKEYVDYQCFRESLVGLTYNDTIQIKENPCYVKKKISKFYIPADMFFTIHQNNESNLIISHSISEEVSSESMTPQERLFVIDKKTKKILYFKQNTYTKNALIHHFSY